MGNQQSEISQEKSTLLNTSHLIDNNQLTFVTNASSQQFGQVRIFRLKVQPYDYIMQYVHQHLKGEISYQNQLKYYKSIPKHRSIVAFDCIKVEGGKQMCVRLVNIKIYCKYYNFTLLDAINAKRIKSEKIKNRQIKKLKKINDLVTDNLDNIYYTPFVDVNKNKSMHTESRVSNFGSSLVKFTEPDLWYVLSTLTSVIHTYKQTYNEQFGKIKPQNIFVSPQGYIKIYLLQTSPKFHENALGCKTQIYQENYKKHEDNNQISAKDSIFKFQENHEVQMNLKVREINQHQAYSHPQKSDIFDIGLTILCMINLDKYDDYFDIKNRPKMQFIHFSINNLDRKGITYDLQILLKGMMSNPQQRFTSDKILSYIENYRNFFEIRKMQSGINYCLKLDSYESEETIASQLNTKSNFGINMSKITHNTLLSADRNLITSGRCQTIPKSHNLIASPISTISQIKNKQQTSKIKLS